LGYADGHWSSSRSWHVAVRTDLIGHDAKSQSRSQTDSDADPPARLLWRFFF
jgi:hypothetical protein